MAVPKKKTSKSRRDQRKSCKRHDNKLSSQNTKVTLTISSETGKATMFYTQNHRVDSEGKYKGVQILQPKKKKTVENDSVQA